MISQPAHVDLPPQQLIEKLQSRIQFMEQEINMLRKLLFGPKHEKRIPPPSPQQLTLGEGLFLPVTQTPVATPLTVGSYQRGKAKKQRDELHPEHGLRFDDTVPVQEIRLEPPEFNTLTPDQYDIIDEQVTYRLAQQPASYIVLKYIRPVIKLKTNAQLIQAAAAPNVLEKSQYDVSFLVGMMVDKLQYHLPLYRLHQKLEQNGIIVSRGGLSQAFHRACALLEAIFQALLRSVLQSKILAMDETPVKAGRKKPGKMKQGYYWPMYGDQDEVVFVFAESRAAKHLLGRMGDFSGVLISDGYAAYERYAHTYAAIIPAQCWVHTRRQFIEAETAELHLCQIACEYIRQLYRHEDDIKVQNLQGEVKQQYRVEHSKPVVEQFFAWLKEEQLRQAFTPNNPFLKAAAYALKREHALRVFLIYPDVPLDTNHLERALRVIPMGRKNWLFNWTEIGAHYVGIVQSLITTCKLHDINPYEYLVDVLLRMDQHPMSKIDELIPRNWKPLFASHPLRSDLYHAMNKNKSYSDEASKSVALA